MRRAKPLSEVRIHFERQKIDNKYMAKCKYEKQEKNVFFILVVFFPKFFFFPRKKSIYITKYICTALQKIFLLGLKQYSVR